MLCFGVFCYIQTLFILQGLRNDYIKLIVIMLVGTDDFNHVVSKLLLSVVLYGY